MSSETTTTEKTRPGNYFVANYPPFSLWNAESVTDLREKLHQPGDSESTFGAYLHLPFCRKRCDFCYFKVYTDKNSQEVRRYLDCVLKEANAYKALPYFQDRSMRFLYFGGGTPSYLSTSQLTELFEGLQKAFSWNTLEEITFECEPGTLTEKKLLTLKDLGVTRLSIGVENFDPEILELNNRAHRAKEIYRAYDFARQIGFPQINIDLIAGMVGETNENWRDCVEKTVALRPDSVTIYQMEIPYNTTIYRRMQDGNRQVAPVADWATKRRWHREAFERLASVGYSWGSAYTAKLDPEVNFLYRDALWTGSDLLGLGVSSFGHLGGVHFQNEHTFESYTSKTEQGELPLYRSYVLNEEEKLIREFILQLKFGRIKFAPFAAKFGVDLKARFSSILDAYQKDGYFEVDDEGIEVTPHGLMRIDTLLHEFFLKEHQNLRYA